MRASEYNTWMHDLPGISLASSAIGLLLATGGAMPCQSRTDQLLLRLYDEQEWTEAARKLRKIGKAAAKPLLAALSKDGEIKHTKRALRILEVLGTMGPDAEEAYSELADSVGQCDPDMFIPIWHTLADLVPYVDGPKGPNAAQGLLQASIGVIRDLKGKDRSRWSAEYNRFNLRSQVEPQAGLKAMIEELDRGQMFKREVAAEVVGRMGKQAIDAIPSLAKALGGKATTKRRTRVVRTATVYARQRADDFQPRAAAAMIAIAPGDPRCAVAYGWRVQHGASATERAQAALRLGSFGKASADQVPELIAALGDETPRVVWEVITALGMIGPSAKSAIPKLKKLSEAKDKAIAVRAKAALKQVEREG